MRVYLDHNATTPLDSQVLEAMLPYLSNRFGNASSIHAWGREARKAVEEARETVARFLGVADKETLVFTSGGTEANNLAIKGVAYAYQEQGRHLIASVVEHPAVLNTLNYLSRRGFEVTLLPVDAEGLLDFEALQKAIRKDTILISLMHANNETGVLFPIAEVGKLARERGILFHTDAVQSFGKLPIDVEAMGIDLLSISAHKLYGPKGVGALYIRPGVKMVALHHGGHQERHRRGGTVNVPGVVGLAKASELAYARMEQEKKHLLTLRDRLERRILEQVDGVRRNGHPVNRLPNTLSLSFEGVDGESLIVSLDLEGIAASSGSACSSGSLEASHVLAAMGVPDGWAPLRFSLGMGNTEDEVDYVLEVLPDVVKRLRKASTLEFKPALALGIS